MRKVNLFIKRVVDILFSMICLTILSPVFIIVPILIFLETTEGPFFKQERIGKLGKKFFILKFKTMISDKTAEVNFDFSKDANRVTKVGQILRRTKIDEIPQLINVLKGDMSLVGPRPTVSIQVEKYSEYEKKRLKMPAGMTGLAQVNGNIALSWEERIKYDVYYVENFDLSMDIKILFKTILVVFYGEERYKKTIDNGSDL